MSTFEINLNDIPEDKRERVEDILDDLFIEWSMEGRAPEDADDIIFEKVNEVLYEI